MAGIFAASRSSSRLPQFLMTDSPVLRSDSSLVRCHVCAAGAVDSVAGYEALCRVTSDCKPMPRGGTLCVCQHCGCVQKVLDATWRAEARRIYSSYDIYQQGDGAEQAVFDASTGKPSRRSEWLLGQLQARVELSITGRLLDVGCGNGAFLRAFGRAREQWSLAGTEVNARHRTEVERIAGVEALYTCAPTDVPGAFDMIAMVHVLEHVPAPRDLLAGLRKRLKSGGLLLIEAPDYRQYPFDLLIADHATHFCADTLPGIVADLGFEIVYLATDWVPKELTLVARKSRHTAQHRCDDAERRSLARVTSRLQWLRSVIEEARQISRAGRFGVFGTAIAATWFVAELGEAVQFFVDEDPQRAGRTHLGRPVYQPQETPTDTDVFIALAPVLAETTRGRLAALKLPLRLYAPKRPQSWGAPAGSSGVEERR